MANTNQTELQITPNQFHPQPESAPKRPLMSTGQPHLAVLIDAENVNPEITRDLFKVVARYGTAYIRLAYGDWTSANQNGWRDVLQTYAIIPVQQFHNTKKKNAADMTMIIEAMDLLHTRRLDGFCLVSSDSDFTRLATRIQSEGLLVIGFGEKDSVTASYVHACDRFHIWERGVGFQVRMPYWQDESQLVKDVRNAFVQVKQKDGWANMGNLAQNLQQMDLSLTAPQHGFSSWRDLLKILPEFEVEARNGNYPYVRERMIGQNGTGRG